MEIDDSNAVYMRILSQLELLSLLLMVAAPPPKDRWQLMERVMQALMHNDTVHAIDIEELKAYLSECTETAKPLLERVKEGPDGVSMGDPQVQAYVHMHVLQSVLSLNNMRNEVESEKVLEQHLLSCISLHHLFEALSPLLRSVVAGAFSAEAQNTTRQ